ncbi:MAG: cobalamin-dependent protein [Tissierellia bacterium]|nr:cobalamin-dependent protein [Tissierellia bacterium]
MENVSKLRDSVLIGDTSTAVEIAEELVKTDIEVEKVVEELSEVMQEIGGKFERFEVFLPELIIAAESFLAVMNIFEPKLIESQSTFGKDRPTIVLGTVKGDFHEIGKIIVELVLKSDGINVIDLGTDVDSVEFMDAAEKNKAEFIGMSALMTTTMPAQQELIHLLEEQGLRDKYKVLVGGAPTSQEWADNIGADGWSFDAFSTARLIKEMVKAN